MTYSELDDKVRQLDEFSDKLEVMIIYMDKMAHGSRSLIRSDEAMIIINYILGCKFRKYARYHIDRKNENYYLMRR